MLLIMLELKQVNPLILFHKKVKAYIIAGLYQPTNICYPASGNNNHCRYFQSSWFKKFSSWLEYSPEKDAAYCLSCYLFGKHYGARNDGKNTFSELGFSNWKKVNNGVNCAFVCHEGSIPNSPHNLCVKSCDDLMAQSKHIDKVLDRHSDETIANNRLRGDDESSGSLNRENFIELIKLLASCNQNVHNVVLENAPENAQYISPSVQKDILHIFARKVRATIREEIGDSKFCIIIDEARDESKREQMSVVLRFVDKHGCVQERFFDLIHVSDTCSLTLKTEISSVLSRHNLDVQNLRGQGYDRASNMRGEWNGLQALFLKDCPFAYYIYCLAHRLQLALVSAAKEVCYVHQFFSKLTLIVNVMTVSPKRHDQLRVAQANNVANLIANDQIVTGSGLNQIGTLQRAGDTRWGSHLNSVRSLLCMFDATCEVLEKSTKEGNFSTRSDASAAYDAITSFEFVFVLHLMRNILELAQRLDVQECSLVIRERPANQPQYSLPTASQVAAIIVGDDIETMVRGRDIKVQTHTGNLKKIQEFVGYYDPLQYPLLFPFGTHGWDINTRTQRGNKVSCRTYYSYMLQERIMQKMLAEERYYHRRLWTVVET
ncbi:uncharacterized protein [Arachis hypogaea]|uniref:uncharacterized protein n=1 Tax=Arachis hypogaea TaxID=3818 RepID=UPI000DEDFAF2|nr:zinc finger MYM-type protein 1-like [Arachis hypogaea]